MLKCWKNSHLLLEGLLREQPDRIPLVWILWVGLSTHSSNMSRLVATKSTGLLCLFILVQTLSGPAFILLLLEGSGGWKERLMAADKGSAITDTLLARALPATVQPTCRAPATCGYHPASAGWCRPFPVLLSRSSSPCKRTRQLCSPLLLKCMSDCVTQLDVPWFAQLSGQSCRKCHQMLILFGWIRKTPALYT